MVARYPGEEARARFGLLLEHLGQTARAQALFAEILASVKGAPGYYRARPEGVDRDRARAPQVAEKKKGGPKAACFHQITPDLE